ncbi:hypothetical protein HK103_005188 [Boothiomyces macroporosus]|uniref:Uncharacterized protein n=1 Tax=Boothiomyces macroporosus TaxID=261099 RepID=A0AAD5UFC1_9FUNG|nr:hypothetical protein HK103_005188 [Boothiomyces macroporosus]
METHSRSASQQPYGQPAPAYMPNASPLPQYAQPMGGQPQYAQPPNQYGQSYQQPPQNAYQTNYAPPPQPPPSNQQGQGFFPQQAPTQGAVNIQLNMAAPTKEPQAQPRQIVTTILTAMAMVITTTTIMVA